MRRGMRFPLVVAMLFSVHGCGDAVEPDNGPAASAPLTPLHAVFTAVVDLSGTNPLNAGECISLTGTTTRFDRCIFYGPVAGDLLDGDYVATLDGTVNAAGNGTMRGDIAMAACMTTRCGDFEGRLTGVSQAGVRSDEIEMTGMDGGVRGLTITGTLVERGAAPGTDVFDFTGTIRSSR